MNSNILIKSSIIIASIIIIYYYDLSLVFSKALVFSAGNLSNYVLLIPFIIAFLLYKSRRTLLAAISISSNKFDKTNTIVGITLIVLALFLYIIISLTLYAEYRMYTILLFATGSILLLFNVKVFRSILIAVLMLAYLQPPPGELVADLAADLSWISASITEVLLKNVIPISLEISYGAPALVINKDNTNIPFYVGEPSSGVYSILGLSLFGLFVSSLVNGAIWKKLSIFVIGFPLFFILNVFRIAIIILLWYNYGYNVSESFHAVSGIIMAFIGTLLLILFSERIMRMNTKIIYSKECHLCNEYKELGENFCLFCGRFLQSLKSINNTPRVALMIILIITGFIAQLYMNVNATGIESKSNITTLDIKSLEGPESKDYLLPNINNYLLEYSYRDKRVESVLNQDASLVFAYKNMTTLKPLVYISIQIATNKHTWESSMVIYPSKVGRPTATIIDIKDVKFDDTNARFFVYKRPNSNLTEAVLYWFERVPLRFGNNYENRNVQIILWNYVDVLVKNNLIKDNNLTEVENFYISLAKPIKEYWNKNINILNTTRVSDALINQSYIFAIIITMPAIIISLTNYKKKENVITKLYNRLIGEDKAIIDAIKKSNIPITQNIFQVYKEITKSDISEKEFIDKLYMAKEGGFISDDIININNESKLIWRVI